MTYRLKDPSEAAPGEYRLTDAALLGIRSLAAAAQYATDQAAVTAKRGGVTTATTILGVTGLLDMTTFTLIATLVDAANVRKGTEIYPGGTVGTLEVGQSFSFSVNAATPRCLSELRKLLSESASWQAKTGATSAGEAEARIYLIEHETDAESMKAARPFALIYPAATRWNRDSGGGGAYYGGTGSIVLQFHDNASTTSRDQVARQQSGITFMSWTEQVIEEILVGAGKDDRLQIASVVRNLQTDGPFRNDTRDEPSGGAFWWTQFHVSWGLAG